MLQNLTNLKRNLMYFLKNIKNLVMN